MHVAKESRTRHLHLACTRVEPSCLGPDVVMARGCQRSLMDFVYISL